jgi:hypothetical protein
MLQAWSQRGDLKDDRHFGEGQVKQLAVAVVKRLAGRNE